MWSKYETGTIHITSGQQLPLGMKGDEIRN